MSDRSTGLAVVALQSGKADAARARLEEALAAARALRDRALEALVWNNLGELARLDGDDTAAAAHYGASLQLYRALDSRTEIPRLVHNLGYLALHADDAALAQDHFAASLAGFRATGQARGIAEALAGLAAVAAWERTAVSATRAARLWGAADASVAAEGHFVWPADRPERIRYAELARETLGAAAFDAALAAGAALPLEEAIAEALPA